MQITAPQQTGNIKARSTTLHNRSINLDPDGTLPQARIHRFTGAGRPWPTGPELPPISNAP